MELYYARIIKDYSDPFADIYPIGFYSDLSKAIEDIRSFPLEKLDMEEIDEDYECDERYYFGRTIYGSDCLGHVVAYLKVNKCPYEIDKLII